MNAEFREKYRERGWAIFPLAPETKQPRSGVKWSQDFHGEWADDDNIAVALGDRSGDLVDIDLDWPESAGLGAALFEDKSASFGRPSSPRSHYLFKSKVKTRKFKLPNSFLSKDVPDEHSLMVAEIRSTGAYTMFPGSVHPSGERVEWANDADVAPIEGEKLGRAVGLLAFLAVCARFWGGPGTRHECALATAAILRRAQIPEEHAQRYIGELCSDDEEIDDRMRTVADTYANDLSAVSGWEKFRDALELPDDARDVLYGWLGIEKERRKVEVDVDGFNERYAVIRNDSQVGILVENRDPDSLFDRVTYSVMSKSSFLLLEGAREHSAKAWLQSPTRRTYQGGFVFDPKGDHAGYLNLWRGWATTPKPGDWRLMRYHINSILADDDPENADYILHWMAWMVQNPDQPAEVALVFRGKKGCGKGTLGRALRMIAGQHGMHVSNPRHLVGNFNLHMRDCIFLFADEAFWAGDKQAEGTLKRIITEDTLLIEPKGVDVKSTKNRLHIMVASNEDWVVPATTDERRFAIFDCSDDVIGDRPYFSDLYAELQNGGLEAMLHDLLAMDLGDWHPRDDIPQTSALRDQIEQSERADRALVRQVLEMGVLPGTHAEYTETNELLYPHFRSRLNRMPYGSRITDKAAGSVLTEIATEKSNNGQLCIGINDEGRPAFKRVTCYIMLALSKARSRFDADGQWPDGPKDWVHERESGDPLDLDDLPF